MLKEAIKRRKPDFNETYYGFRAFGNLLEEAQARGLLEFGRDEKSGAYVYRSSGHAPRNEAVPETQAQPMPLPSPEHAGGVETAEPGGKPAPRRKGRGSRKPVEKVAEQRAEAVIGETPPTAAETVLAGAAEEVSGAAAKKTAPRTRRPRKPKAAPEAA